MGILTGVDEPFRAALQLFLAQNCPNPFNPTTTIRCELPEKSFVSQKVYEIIGREVAVLINEVKKPGRYEVEFDGSKASTVIYVYRLGPEGYVETKERILIR